MKITNCEILDNPQVVRYTFDKKTTTTEVDAKGNETSKEIDLQYDIPRVFTREEADASLLSFMESYEDNSALSVDDWATDTKDLTVDKIRERVQLDIDTQNESNAAQNGSDEESDSEHSNG